METPPKPQTDVYLSLGSNMGQRTANLKSAVDRLARYLDRIRVSSIYETEPMYVADQPAFLNIAVTGATSLHPESLLHRCQAIEADLGRNRSRDVPKGPRLIDLDILLYGDRIIRAPGLEIPHPLMNERRFVLVPLLELAPDLRDPITATPYAEGLEELEDQGVYMFAPWEYTQDAYRP
jgi:2-amino-4-hydroxy-6-hydroxymethyldihydropteridine diphosphokinase